MCAALFQTGYIVGEMSHVDIRKKGSGNAGTTNALRVLGWKAGLLTICRGCDQVRSGIPDRLFHVPGEATAGLLLTLYAGAGVTLGHNFPFYMNFKGGKGDRRDGRACGCQQLLASAAESSYDPGHTGFLSCSGDLVTRYISVGIPCGLYRFSDRDDPHRTGRLAGYAGVILL